jgi:peptidoglycan/LPS O-acetylase OafA/YrhL
MAFKEIRLSPVLIIIGALPVWLAASGMIDMFSLPFSDTDYFDFNPHPALGVGVATLAFPVLMSVLACISSALAGRHFGVVTAVGAAFIVIAMLTSIIPNDALIPTIPFYTANIIPFVVADALMSFSRSKISLYAAGAIVGIAFFTLYYPLITYTYNAVLEQKTIWPSLIAPTYFEMVGTVFPLVAAPAALMGTAGALASEKLIAKNKAL